MPRLRLTLTGSAAALADWTAAALTPRVTSSSLGRRLTGRRAVGAQSGAEERCGVMSVVRESPSHGSSGSYDVQEAERRERVSENVQIIVLSYYFYACFHLYYVTAIFA